MDDIVEFLKMLAESAGKEPPDIEDRMMNAADGGNFDDAYHMGLDDGLALKEIEIGGAAAKLLEKLKHE